MIISNTGELQIFLATLFPPTECIDKLEFDMLKITKNLVKYCWLFIVMIFVLMLQSGCVNNIGKESSARTFYESLDLSSPESAVKTFTDAFQKEDYYTVFLIFSPSLSINSILCLLSSDILSFSASRDLICIRSFSCSFLHESNYCLIYWFCLCILSSLA